MIPVRANGDIPRDRSALWHWENPPVEVDAADFMPQEESAKTLRVRPLSVGRLIAEGRLRPAVYQGSPGVTRQSVLEELSRRRNPKTRIKYALKSFFHWFSI